MQLLWLFGQNIHNINHLFVCAGELSDLRHMRRISADPEHLGQFSGQIVDFLSKNCIEVTYKRGKVTLICH